MMVRLVDRWPRLGAVDLSRRFVPPPRFDEVRFAGYSPDPAHPSQATAVEALETFAGRPTPRVHRWLQRKDEGRRRALYLDGGFGVGKTHLLASLWHATAGTKAYMTFSELTAYIGFAGMANAVETFERHELLCVDEFELDDVANTLMVVSFLRGVMDDKYTRLAVTSNTLPDRLGEQRFSASEFRREIAAIASHFDEIRIDGADFRSSHEPTRIVNTPADTGKITNDTFDDLLAHLQGVHPVQYGALLDGVDAVVISATRRIDAQDEALAFVTFVDKLYDAHIPVMVDGCKTDELFAAGYRSGGYRKKYGRAESRLAAMRAESADLL